MKTFIKFLLLVLVLTTVSCGKSIKEGFQQEETEYVDTYNKSKVISGKDTPIEHNVSASGLLLGIGNTIKPYTVYYFYSNDGTKIKVEPEIFFSKNVGDTYSGHWR